MALSMKLSLFQLLKLDTYLRVPTNSRPLFCYDGKVEVDIEVTDISKFPAINPIRREPLNPLNRETFRSCYEKLLKKFPHINKINMKNVLIAGGAVCKALMSGYHDRSDCDIFLYGLRENEFALKMSEVINQLTQDEPHYMIVPQSKVTTIYIFTYDYKLVEGIVRSPEKTYVDVFKYQIIHRGYKNPAEVLYGFDLGGSAVGWTGSKFVMSLMGFVAIKYGVNIVDTTRRSTTYEYRLEKYMRIGFSMVLPFAGTCDAKGFDLGKRAVKHVATDSDYGDTTNDVEYNATWFAIMIYNILAGEKKYFASPASREFIINMKNMGMLRKFEDLTYLKQTFPTELFIEFASDAGRTVHHMYSRFISTKFVDSLEDCWKIVPQEWIFSNPGTQICGSFNPIVEDPQNWYLDDFRQNKFDRYTSTKVSVLILSFMRHLSMITTSAPQE